ncbi:17372_t:CDS:10 [Cetraspora pellucida]|uniref:17372_t:CDS:1 n=1 Tax=Cetraspora pellucida TaxID=1433469 RepID=A0A9N9GH56_9GLOM|nr:17372_t:CDS:10 [Cetraspora pellucida]
MSFRNKLNFYNMLDRLIPSDILNQDYDKDYVARRNLLQARSVIIVTVSVCIALLLQLLVDLCLILLNGSINHSEFPWPITLFGTTFYVGFQTLSHANFFAVPPFGSIGKETPISLSATGWVAYEQEFQYNQERMQKSLDEAKSAEIAKSMFISNVSHGILATVEILSNTKLNESQRALLKAIESCGTNLISVVNQVLTYAKIEHGKMELENKVFDIYAVMQEIGDALAPISERKKLNFDICIKMNPMHRFLAGDVGVLRQIILNIKFTDEGDVELITVELTDEVESKQENKQKISLPSESGVINSDEHSSESQKVKFRIEVTDTGPGIDPDFMSHMCRPFSQEDSSLRRKFEGTGLGLSIVKEVESNVGKGSKFSFVLELPLSQRLDSLVPSQYPFDHQYLLLAYEKQTQLISYSKSLFFVVLESENTEFLRRITYYLDQWEFKYRLIKKEELKVEFEKEHVDIVILNDSLSDLEWFLDEFVQFYKPVKCIKEGGEESIVREHKDEKKQRIVFFSKIEDYQNAENTLQKYKVRFAVVISKPAGPVKILTAIIKVVESLLSPTSEPVCVIKEEPAIYNYVQTQEICLGSDLLCSPSMYGSTADMTEGFPIGVGEKAIVSSGSDTTSTERTEVKSIEEQPSEVERSDEKKEKETEEKKSLKDISFLIVEDNKINAMILKTMLRQAGFNNYDVAANGLQAVQKFSKTLYDIIFMDLQMPICDGIEATKEVENGEESYLISETLKSSDPTSHYGKRRKKAIIIAMTGLASEEDSEAAEAAGCNEFLTKPVSIKTLNSRMECWTREILESDTGENIIEETKPQEEKEKRPSQIIEETVEQPQIELEMKSDTPLVPLRPI